MQPWENTELEQLRETTSTWAARTLAGESARRDRDGEFSRERWKLCAEQGLLGTCVSPELGGGGKPVTHAVAALEGLGHGCDDGGFVYAIVSQLFGICMPLQLHASEELKRKYLPKVIAGELMLAHAFTEEDSGSDAFSMKTRAEQTKTGWRLSGKKSFLTNAPSADVALVFARTAEGRSPFGLTAFLVDLSWKGVSRGREFEKAGLRTVHMGELLFEDVEIPNEHVVSRPGAGLQLLVESTGWERAVLLTAALGPMMRTVEECVERARTRQQFGKAIGAHQQISAAIADMIMRQRMCRMAIYDMASRLGAGVSTRSLMQETSMTKLFVSENYVQVQLAALQIFGVRGYLQESPIQQRLRDAVSSTIYAGTSEILRNIIARTAGLPVS